MSPTSYTCTVCGWPFEASRNAGVCGKNCETLKGKFKRRGTTLPPPTFPTRRGWEAWVFTVLPQRTYNRVADTWTVNGYVSVSGHLNRWWVNEGENAKRLTGPFPTPLAAMEHAERVFPELFETKGEK